MLNSLPKQHQKVHAVNKILNRPTFPEISAPSARPSDPSDDRLPRLFDRSTSSQSLKPQGYYRKLQGTIRLQWDPACRLLTLYWSNTPALFTSRNNIENFIPSSIGDISLESKVGVRERSYDGIGAFHHQIISFTEWTWESVGQYQSGYWSNWGVDKINISR